MKFVCPKCMQALALREGGSAVCPLGHSYDRSREGYYNLLLSGGASHGDNREMVEARRAFLDTGAYEPLAKRLAESLFPYTERGAEHSLLDVGCGEGYYTSYIDSYLRAAERDVSISGFDISKDAVRFAAKKNKRLSLAVASAYHIPAADESFDFATCLFSPLAREEIHRILRTGGIFLMAIPDREHLFGLKSRIYDTPYKNEPQPSSLSGFRLLSEEHISYNLSLDSKEKIRSLFMMTPYAYRTGAVERERVLSLNSLETEVAFVLFVYEKI